MNKEEHKKKRIIVIALIMLVAFVGLWNTSKGYTFSGISATVWGLSLIILFGLLCKWSEK